MPERSIQPSAGRDPGRRESRVLLWAGFGGLLVLMAVMGLSAISFLYRIEIRQERIRQDFVDRDRTLERLRSSIYLSGTYVRDFLLDDSEARAAAHRQRFLNTRAQIEAGLADYRRLLRPAARQIFEQLSREVQDYLATVTPALDWTPAQRQQRGYGFIRDEVLPKRMTAVGLADQIQQLSERQLELSSQAVSDLFASFRLQLLLLLILAISIGLVLAGVTLWKLLRLEKESELRFRQMLNAQEELKRLSAELLSAQENERRRISRELHDEVGQVLSAMMLGLGNLRSALRGNNLQESLRQLQLVQDMTERNASVVRNISLLLRPTMLDDLGLVPALRWLAREVSRTSGMQVDVDADDCPEDLPDEHRTTIYRVVQEAVRNASRHSGARQARIQVHPATPGRLRVSVQDDGRGFDPDQEAGLGILGMEERVVHLGGVLRVLSQRGRGTTVSFELPLPPEIPQPSKPAAQETSPLRTA